jgi:hypothetical protein
MESLEIIYVYEFRKLLLCFQSKRLIKESIIQKSRE